MNETGQPVLRISLSRINNNYLVLRELKSMGDMITIILNGFEEKVPSNSTIAAIIELFEERDAHLIVEHNGRFVYPKDYGLVTVKNGDRVEFINPSFGG